MPEGTTSSVALQGPPLALSGTGGVRTGTGLRCVCRWCSRLCCPGRRWASWPGRAWRPASPGSAPLHGWRTAGASARSVFVPRGPARWRDRLCERGHPGRASPSAAHGSTSLWGSRKVHCGTAGHERSRGDRVGAGQAEKHRNCRVQRGFPAGHRQGTRGEVVRCLLGRRPCLLAKRAERKASPRFGVRAAGGGGVRRQQAGRGRGAMARAARDARSAQPWPPLLRQRWGAGCQEWTPHPPPGGIVFGHWARLMTSAGWKAATARGSARPRAIDGVGWTAPTIEKPREREDHRAQLQHRPPRLT